MRLVSLAILILLTMILNTCELDMSRDSTDHGTYFRIEPSSVTVAESRTADFEVKTDARIDQVYNVNCYLSDNTLAAVEYYPLERRATVRTQSPGSVYLVAYHAVLGERIDTATVTILPVTTHRIEINPGPVSISVSETSWLSGVAKDSVGVILHRPTDWTWSSSNHSIVSFTTGIPAPNEVQVSIIGRSQGQALITVRHENLTAIAMVTVE